MKKYTHALYMAEKSFLAASLKEAKFMTVTCDGWTDSTNNSWMSITLHWVHPKTWEMQTSIGHMARIYPLEKSAEVLQVVLQEYLDWSANSISVDQLNTIDVEMGEEDILKCKALELDIA
mmetsp:Transcript_25099/g.63084  ORF Transcript_25099/g.63084 Transcript_25099/m.63084 type:complete len:120 (+) Transcript_25099:204-563(+)